MWWETLLWCLFALVVGAILGFFISRYYFKKQIQNNPPINEKMIRAMFMQMGRKPSEAQIKAVIKSMNNQKQFITQSIC